MAHAPSGKNRRVKPSSELNLVPMIDMVTNLMFFLMMFASVLPVTVIDAPLPKIASTAEEVKKAKESDAKLEVTVAITKNGFNVTSDFMGNKNIPLTADGKFDYASLHSFLVQLKSKRPDAKEITLNPSDETLYEVMVEVMDSARELANGDTGYKTVPPEIAQKPEAQQFNRLFPDVSIGGV